MDLTQLQTLIQVAELGSLSKAADRLRIAQPALSRQVRLLEEELGVTLFERHGRGMLLTERGDAVLKRAIEIMATVDEIRSEADDQARSITGRIAIGMPPTVSDILAVPLVHHLASHHPKLELRLISSFTGHLIDWLQRGEVDVAILYDPQASRSLRLTPLLLENLMLIGPPSSYLQATHPRAFKDLADYPILLPSPRHGLRRLIEEAATLTGIHLRVAIEADSFATLKDLVRSGYGYTILPLSAVAGEIANGSLVVAPLVDPAPARRLVIATSRDRPPTRAARRTVDALDDVARTLVEAGAWPAQMITSDR
jgi:DNA-binding transcriptional LysR family regulator